MDLIALWLGGRHLVTLHLLLDNQSVTRTAERLCTTPSTVSKTLTNCGICWGINCSIVRQPAAAHPHGRSTGPHPGTWATGELDGLTR